MNSHGALRRLLRLSPLTPVRRLPIGLQVADQIRHRIVLGELLPGDRLPSQRRMADALGVSVPTLSAAVLALRHAGVVETRQGVGTYVVRRSRPLRLVPIELRRAAPDELHETRSNVELAAVRRAAAHRTDNHLRNLTFALGELRRALLSEDPRQIAVSDLEFHRLIIVAAGTPLVTIIHDGLAVRLRSEMTGRAHQLWKTADLLDRHHRLVSALERRDARHARAVLSAILDSESPKPVGHPP